MSTDIAEPVEAAVTEAPVVETPASDAAVPSSREAWEQAYSKIFEPAGKAETKAETPAESEDKAESQPRAQDGRFAPKASEKPADGQTAPVAPVAAPDAAAPPARLSRAAQDAWTQTPDVVRAEVARMERELTQGLDKYREAATAFEPLRPFDEMARSGGTTLDKALDAYVGMEKLLREDPLKGVLAVCQNIGIDPRAIAQALIGDPSAPVTGPTPEVVALRNELAQLKAEMSGVTTQVKQRDVLSTLQQFAADKPDFEALSAPIAKMLQTGFAGDLQTAYDMAKRLHPDLAAPVEASPAKPAPEPAHIRKAGLSVTGSPSTTASNAATRTNPPPARSSRQAVEAALAKVGIH